MARETDGGMNDERVLVIMGSGETTPTMVETHKRLLARAGEDADAVVVDTPYGFQENRDDITARTREYFERNVQRPVEAVRLAGVEEMGAAALRTAEARVAAAGWIFAGPGSPSYLLRQWRRTTVPEMLADKLAEGGVVVFASAAACTLGSHAVPVYEIYKAGFEPFWLEGVDLMSGIGLDAVVIPHFDNAEGGTHDTRYCYLGERRLAAMEAELPGDTWVLGVDEHTAAILDLEAGTLTVDGRGGVTVRDRGARAVIPAGETRDLAGLRELAGTRPGGTLEARAAAAEAGTPADPGEQADAPGAAGEAGSPLLEDVARCRREFETALEAGDATAAVEAVLGLEETIRAWSADTFQSDELDRAVATLRRMIARLGAAADAGLHDHRDVVAPHVGALLDLRDRARDAGDYDTADRIRDDLAAGGVEVRDGAEGTEWVYDEERGSQ